MGPTEVKLPNFDQYEIIWPCEFWNSATLQNNGTDLSLTAECVAVGDDSYVKMNIHNTIRATRKWIGASRVVAVSVGVV